MTELVNFIIHIMKISNFRHKLAFKQVVRFKVLQYTFVECVSRWFYFLLGFLFTNQIVMQVYTFLKQMSTKLNMYIVLNCQNVYYLGPFFTPKKDFKIILMSYYKYNLTFVLQYYWIYLTHCVKEKKCSASLAFHLFSSTRLINSIKLEHSCKILYVSAQVNLSFEFGNDFAEEETENCCFANRI